MKRIILIDGNNLYSRGYWISRKKMKDPLEFAIEMFLNLREKNKEARFIFAFDTTKSERRLKLYPEYKAGRKSSMTPEEREVYNKKLEAFIQVVRASYHTVLTGEGYEADDFIACCSSMLKMRYDVTIVSMDQDLFQLVNRFVKVFDPVKVITVDAENFQNVTEIPLEHFLDYKCIIGDTSDNIPGFDGIAEKSAKKFIEQYGSFEKIVAALSEKEPNKLTKRELELVTRTDLFARNKELMDLSLYFTDQVLQTHIKRMVNSTAVDKETLNRVLCEHDLSHLYRKMLELCLGK